MPGGPVPTYQYTCTDCGEPVEAVQKFTDDPLSVCAACGGRLRKVFSPVGIVFKGSGFYRTDSRNGSSSGTAAKDKQPSESSSASNATPDKPADKKSSDKGDKVAASSGSSSSGSSSSSSSEKVA
jgi:putative FmdB family regulatory protein